MIKHWRTSCPEIQANLPSNDLVMDDEGLRGMVMDLLRRAQTKSKNTRMLPFFVNIIKLVKLAFWNARSVQCPGPLEAV